MRNLLYEIDRPQASATKVYEDNTTCIKMTENPVISGRNKYVELDCHFVRDHCKLVNIEIHKIDTESQHTDLLTKRLPHIKLW